MILGLNPFSDNQKPSAALSGNGCEFMSMGRRDGPFPGRLSGGEVRNQDPQADDEEDCAAGEVGPHPEPPAQSA